jgi:hypothetical protein
MKMEGREEEEELLLQGWTKSGMQWDSPWQDVGVPLRLQSQHWEALRSEKLPRGGGQVKE